MGVAPGGAEHPSRSLLPLALSATNAIALNIYNQYSISPILARTLSDQFMDCFSRVISVVVNDPSMIQNDLISSIVVLSGACRRPVRGGGAPH